MGNSLNKYAPSILLMLVGAALYALGTMASGPLDNPLLAFWVLVLLVGVGLFWVGLTGISKTRARDSR